MSTKFVTQGTTIIKEAVQKDNDGAYEEALALYKQGIEYLLTGRKYEKNERIKAAISEKVRMYMKRAEEIASMLKEPPKPAPKKKKKSKAKSSSGEPGDSGEEKEEDEDDAKLKAALSGAIVMETPDVKWDDVAGLEVAKGLLKEAVILPIKFPQLFTGKRKPWQGILLYGPPGTGKSFLAKAVATEADNSTFFSVSSSDLISKYVGESEKLVKSLFTMARDKKPSIIFIDEIDSLAGKRGDGEAEGTRRVKTEFLVQMQGVGHDQTGVLTLGATNCPWDLDPAIRRRFTKRIYIPLPEREARTVMFKIHIGSTPADLSEEDFAMLGDKTPGFSGSDISGIVQDALMQPVRTMQDATHFKYVKDPEDGETIIVPCSPADPMGKEMSLMEIPMEDQEKVRAPPLKIEHFLRVLATCKPSVGKEDIERHVDWTTEFGQEGV
jgi:vacuolar protein-sorting-associated protein 4